MADPKVGQSVAEIRLPELLVRLKCVEQHSMRVRPSQRNVQSGNPVQQLLLRLSMAQRKTRSPRNHFAKPRSAHIHHLCALRLAKIARWWPRPTQAA